MLLGAIPRLRGPCQSVFEGNDPLVFTLKGTEVVVLSFCGANSVRLLQAS